MFRCDWCKNYRDKSERLENPEDDSENICQECADKQEWADIHTEKLEILQRRYKYEMENFGYV